MVLTRVPGSKGYEVPFHELAIHGSYEPVSNDAYPVIDPESVEHFCHVWADVGRAILARRQKI